MVDVAYIGGGGAAREERLEILALQKLGTAERAMAQAADTRTAHDERRTADEQYADVAPEEHGEEDDDQGGGDDDADLQVRPD